MLSTTTSGPQESRFPRPKMVVPERGVDALDLEEKQLGAELVAWLLAKGREKLSLLVESEGKAYRISIEPDKKVPVLHERW